MCLEKENGKLLLEKRYYLIIYKNQKQKMREHIIKKTIYYKDKRKK